MSSSSDEDGLPPLELIPGTMGLSAASNGGAGGYPGAYFWD